MITVEQYKAHNPQLVGATIDARLLDMIGEADSLIASYCAFPAPDGSTRRTLAQSTYTLRPRPGVDERAAALQLALYPIVSVTSVHVSTSWDFDASSLVDPGDYEIDERSGDLWMRPNASRVWSTQVRANQAIVVAGYPNTLPDDHGLVAIVALLTQHLLSSGHNRTSLSVSTGPQSRTSERQRSLIPADLRSALTPYVLWERRVG